MKVSLVNSNALSIPLADNSVHCVITSPPYYGLRDYSISGQLGLEPTLQEYIDNTIKWCAEVWRVLRDDGTFWLNLGDSYTSGNRKTRDPGQSKLHPAQPKGTERTKTPEGMKPKDLMLVPHRVAIALQEWGWWVRSDIVWHKPNPMPESMTDRPTKSHEYIFLLTKNKKYYYDADAIRETSTDPESFKGRRTRGPKSIYTEGGYAPGMSPQSIDTGNGPDGKTYPKRNKRTVWTTDEDEFSQFLDWKASQIKYKSDTWTITTKPYKGAHFATFPPEIPEICIKAGTSEKGVCPVCGNQWERITEKETTFEGGSGKAGRTPEEIGGKWGDDRYGKNILLGPVNHVTTTGWKPTCPHDEEPVPATVLDPFGGSGTTAMVANQLGRRGISLDLSWEYLQLARERTGIKALDDWGKGIEAETNLEGLPMFEGVE